MSDLKANYINKLSEFFAAGEKSSHIHTLGVEIEHFIVYADTNEALSYYGEIGVAHIITELASYYPDSTINLNGPMLGFQTDKFYITLEPGAQLEISILPKPDILSLKKVYEVFITNLNSVLTPLGLKYVTFGYHPYSKASNINIIPKKRYEYMDRYFKTSGTCGMNMMRGTASVQVSVDYSNQEDFRQKFQAAYVLSPYFKLITDNCPVFEGEKNIKPLLRSYIWENVDGIRGGLIPDVMKNDFGYNDYADYVFNVPPIFLPEHITGDIDQYTDSMLPLECLDGAELSLNYIKHFISMVFPDVRLKNYIEIRVADSMPIEKTFAYVTFIKAIFYNEDSLDYITNLIIENNITNRDIKDNLKDIIKNGYNAKFYSTTIAKLHKTLLEMAFAFLPKDEISLLMPLKKLYN